MRTAIDELLSEAVEALRIRSDGSFTWFGSRCNAMPARLRAGMRQSVARDALSFRLQQVLYRHFYATGFARPFPETDRIGENLGGARSRVEREYLQGGWRVVSRGKLDSVLMKDGIKFRVPAHRVRQVNGRTFVRTSRDGVFNSTGFRSIVSTIEPRRGAKLVRTYWNVRSDARYAFLEETTKLLDRSRLPYRAKILTDPNSYDRCDAGVVYVFRPDMSKAGPYLRELYGRISDKLRPFQPVFTKSLAPGLSLAEDPGTDQSFGEHRCQLVAQALLTARRKCETRIPEVLERIHVEFESAGCSINAPYLNRRSRDMYEPIVP